MSNVSEWNIAAASNNSAPPNGFPEAMAASALNDGAREVMAAIARWYQDFNGTLDSTGSSNAYVLTTNNGHTDLADVPPTTFKANFANTDACTLAIDGLTAKAIKKSYDVELASGDIKSGQIVTVIYNPTDDWFEMVQPGNTITPIGAITGYAGSTEPAGWMFCDGSALDASVNTEFADLYTVIGITYGGTDNTDFQVPDLRGRVIAGKDNMNSSLGTGGGDAARLTSAVTIDGDTLGTGGGAQSVTLSTANLPSHSHGAGTLKFLVSGSSSGGENTTAWYAGLVGSATGTISGSTATAGSGTAHANVQPTLVLNYIIRYQ